MAKQDEMTISLTEAQFNRLTRLLDNAIMDTSNNGAARTYQAIVRKLDRLSVQRTRARRKLDA